MDLAVQEDKNVNHPSHYNVEGKKECIVEMREKYGDTALACFCLLNAYKYRYRYELKNGKEDLEKAKWYIDYYTRNLSNGLSGDSIVDDINKLYKDLLEGGL